jgi:hypothetical protein
MIERRMLEAIKTYVRSGALTANGYAKTISGYGLSLLSKDLRIRYSLLLF